MSLPRHLVDEVIQRALAEDLGTAGDLTTDAVVPPDRTAEAVIVAREGGVVAGLPVAARVFELVSPMIAVDLLLDDGSRVGPGTVLATLSGPAASILTAERTALNLLGRAAGVATATADLVARVEGTGVRIADTRKTTPGLRALEKYAVRMGGGHNHRFGLHDAVMIKDNHLAAAGGVRPAVERARARVGHTVTITVEVENLDQLGELLEVGADVVLLDNMDPPTLHKAVEMVNGRMLTEASGGITPDTIRAVAETGVDAISVGWITHSAPALDVALDFR